ncbi:low affinity immunoglobulin epsilon Fc receptor-like [Babylonia areolata]|uniref:low affinity immunoglobulin epsilon Fc receptor-like n=1 Tax=Babylonia areolata TaxID=304850 RepID=UPI003FD3820A
MVGLHAALFLVFSVYGVVVSGGECPTGWTAHGRSCYVFLPDRLTWLDAKVLCQSVHGDIVEIETPGENSFVKTLLNDHNAANAWIGLQDFVVEGDFVWTSAGLSAEYTNWGPNEPDNYNTGQDCGVIAGSSGQWDDLECTGGLPVVCEMEAANAEGIVG